MIVKQTQKHCGLCYWLLDAPLGEPIPHTRTACLANMICDRTTARTIIAAARGIVGMNVTRPEVYEGRDSAKYRLALALNEADKDGPFTLEAPEGGS